MPQSDTVYLDVEEVVARTPKAMKVRLEDQTEHWLPLALVREGRDYEVGATRLTIAIPEFLAEEKGITVD